jgi:hypothetical protein
MPAKYTCPYCDDCADKVIPVDPDAAPQLNDLYLCGQCGHPSKFFPKSLLDANLSLVKLVEEEFKALPKDVQGDLMFAMRNIVAAAMRAKKKKIITLPLWGQN